MKKAQVSMPPPPPRRRAPNDEGCPNPESFVRGTNDDATLSKLYDSEPDSPTCAQMYLGSWFEPLSAILCEMNVCALKESFAGMSTKTSTEFPFEIIDSSLGYWKREQLTPAKL